ncbi:hypothetical protein HYQ44_008066 [Verticillium longisporum]|nr:hypothetical protein HYQ44_008066 [Verticillium longisporum]
MALVALALPAKVAALPSGKLYRGRLMISSLSCGLALGRADGVGADGRLTGVSFSSFSLRAELASVVKKIAS